MRYIVLIHSDESAEQTPPSDSMMEAMTTFWSDHTHGKIVNDGGLAPSSSATVLRVGNAATTELSGPFSGAKEVVGGFFVVESPSADDMAIWSRQFADLHADHWPGLSMVAEVREIVTPPSQ